ncbi:MAG: hypothetical protein JXD21_08795 [Candidatus Omnitrophica bacterium]|nr:hypothetical protein [Candidatus Omnitrophota bacterium]
MPTYDYECLECGNRFEAFQKMTDKPLKSCPSCKGKVKRLIGAGMGLIFKGSGFYSTDYKKKDPSTDSKKSGQSSCDGSGSSCDNCPKQENK